MASGAEKLHGGRRQSGHADGAAPALLPSPRAWRAAWALIAAHRWRLAAGFVLMLLNRLCGLVAPFTAKRFLDDVVGAGRWDLLPLLATLIGLAAVAAAVTSFALGRLLGVAAAHAVAEARELNFARVIRWPVNRLDRMTTGALLSRIWHDADAVRPFVGRDVVQLAASVVIALLALAALLSIDPWLTVIVATVLGLFGVGIAAASGRLRPIFRERGRLMAEMTGRLGESLGGVRIVKAYAAEPREDRAFSDRAERLFDNVRRAMIGTAAVNAFFTAMLGIAALVVMVTGGAAVQRKAMSAGDVAMYVSFLALLTLPVAQLSALAGPLAEAFAGVERMEELRQVRIEADDDAAAGAAAVGSPPLTMRGDVAFQDVSFEYTPGVPVLHHISFDAAAGTTTALVGSSGAGKTTLVGLLMALHRPTAGRVLVDGHDLAGLARESYRRNLGVVLQDDVLFDGTIAENIAFSMPDASPASIRGAGTSAGCDEFVAGFADGYDTLIGERGIRLSGGQRQRVAIARALLANPAILILDEATSSLDSGTEALIQDALQRLRRGRTTVVIAHRLSTIMSADQIVVLERGAVVERGSHAALLDRHGRYRQLYDRQYRAVGLPPAGIRAGA